jgi:Heterokaryon incompatibility protein (HET)
MRPSDPSSPPAQRSLDPHKEGYRVLRLKPLKHNTENGLSDLLISCEIQHVARTDRVEYTALSYAWGDGIADQEILVGDSVQLISLNLANALRELRDDTFDVLLWVDQLCINQKDDDEKSNQVQKMKSLYEGAHHVVAWLGPSADNSDLVMTMFKEVAKADNQTLSIVGDIARSLTEHPSNTTSDVEWDEQKILAVLPEAFDSFCRRGYWARLWVIQEFAVAQELTLACGSSRIPFEDFQKAWWLVYDPNWPYSNLPERPSTMSQICHSTANSFVCGIVTRRVRYQQGLGGELDELFSVMIINLTLEVDYNQPLTSDPRDRVFSLMGLAGDRDKFRQFPDYSMSVEDVYEELARQFFRLGHIDNLTHCQFPRPRETQPGSRKMPTWAADWSMEIRGPIIGIPTRSAFLASGGWEQDQEIATPDSKTLILRGVLVDHVETIGALWDPDWLEEELDAGMALPYLNDIETFCRSSSRIRVHEEEVDCARISVADRGYFVTADAQTSLVESYRAAIEWFKAKHGAYRDAMYEHTFWLKGLHSRRPFLSRTGYVGLAPAHVAEGDAICIFLGGKCPFVLRPAGGAEKKGAFRLVGFLGGKSAHDLRSTDKKGAFSLIGEAYVHGIMYGEFMKSNPDIQSFTLV